MEATGENLREEIERARAECKDALPYNIKRLREMRKYSVGWVAEQLGRAKITVYKWESGERNLTPKDIVALSRLYHVGVEEIFKNPFGPNCGECGAALERKYRFCPECGARMIYKGEG